MNLSFSASPFLIVFFTGDFQAGRVRAHFHVENDTFAHAALGYILSRAIIDEVGGRINASQVGAFAQNRKGQTVTEF